MRQIIDSASSLFPGLLLATMIAMAAQFLSLNYDIPVMLMAVLLGMPLQFLSEEQKTKAGIAFASRTLLRVGVALLGTRVSLQMFQAIGPQFVAFIVFSVSATILLSLAVMPLIGRDRHLGFLTGGAVAICGASAAMAISSILPKNHHTERDLSFTVISVTILSTIAMITYPLIAQTFGLDERHTGLFLGATIHDVAQVVGAGYSVSEQSGDLATFVKLLRVTLLAPVIFLGAVLMRNKISDKSQRPPLIPGFVIGFLVLAGLNSFDLIPSALAAPLDATSRSALVIAVAAVGMRTSFAALRGVGNKVIAMLTLQTAFLGILVLAGLMYF